MCCIVTHSYCLNGLYGIFKWVFVFPATRNVVYFTPVWNWLLHVESGCTHHISKEIYLIFLLKIEEIPTFFCYCQFNWTTQMDGVSRSTSELRFRKLFEYVSKGAPFPLSIRKDSPGSEITKVGNNQSHNLQILRSN